MSQRIVEIRTAIRPLLACLWIAWFVVLFGYVIEGLINESATLKIPGWCKMTSSVLLVFAGWTWYAALQARPGDTMTVARRVALLMTAGMALGTLGDFFNAGRLQEVIPLEDPVLGGLTSFLVGHICYIAACLILAGHCQLRDAKSWWIAVGVWQLVAVIGWYLVVYRGDTDAAFKWAALPYSMLLAGTAGVTAALALQRKRLTLLALGGALFLISDLILGYQIAQGPVWAAGEPVWMTYGPGQMLLVFAIGAMVSLLPDQE